MWSLWYTVSNVYFINLMILDIYNNLYNLNIDIHYFQHMGITLSVILCVTTVFDSFLET